MRYGTRRHRCPKQPADNWNPPLNLPVAPFEHSMYADDRRETPMCFFVRLRFSGKLVSEAMRQAILAAQARHPLTRAVIAGKRKARTKELGWRVSAENAPHIDFASPPDRPGYPAGEPYIDLRKEIGLRFFFSAGKGGVDLLVQVHHAVCDGIGISRFLEDVLIIYDASVLNTTTTGFRAIDPALLSRRRDMGLGRAGLLRRLGGDLIRIARMKQPAEPIAALPPAIERSRSIGDLDFPGRQSAILPDSVLGELKREAEAAGGSTNDVLVRNLFLAIARHNDAHGGARRVRLWIPTDLRGIGLERMPAANVVSMAFISRTAGEIGRGSSQLLRSIVLETARIKKNRAGIALLQAASIAGGLSGGLVYLCSPGFCYATAVLSNLGQPFRNSVLSGKDGKLTAGGLKLESYELLPPIRPLTHLAIGVVDYGGRMHISANHDPRSLNDEQVARILGDLAGRTGEPHHGGISSSS